MRPALRLSTEPGEAVPHAAAWTRLFAAFDEAGITWCSWKSNEHLEAGLAGFTDIDLLFRSADHIAAARIFHEAGFIRFDTPPHRSYPGLVDFLNVDPDSGRILHAHAHFLLTLGERHVKSFCFPWSEGILDRRIAHADFSHVYTSCPADEGVLLLAREAIKRGTMTGGAAREWRWIMDRTTPVALEDSAKIMLDPSCAHIVHEIAIHGVTREGLEQLRADILALAQDRKWRRMSQTDAAIQGGHREIMWLLTRLAEKTGIDQTFIVRRRVLPRKGLVVAFVGPDGAGKSTVTKTLREEWEHKMDVVRLYFGTGDGVQRLLGAVAKIRRRNVRAGRTQAVVVSDIPDQSTPSPGTIIAAIAGAVRRYCLMCRAVWLRRRGHVVLCDRWPQNSVNGMNDGPLLSALRDHPRRTLRFLSRFEARLHETLCAMTEPDIIIRLIPTLDTAVARKPENAQMAAGIGAKIETLETLNFSGSAANHVIDADRSLPEVLGQVRRIVWNHLAERDAPRPDFFECVGLPGAGKTTLCGTIKGFRSVSEIYRQQPDMPKRIALIAGSLFHDALLYVSCAKLALKLRMGNNRAALSRLFRLPVQKRKIALAARDGRWLLEQYLLQNLWSVLIDADIDAASPEILAPFITRLYRGLDPLIVFFDLPDHEASRRVAARKDGQSRFDRMDGVEIESALQKGATAMRAVINASLYAGLHIVTLDARRPAEDGERALRNIVTA